MLMCDTLIFSVLVFLSKLVGIQGCDQQILNKTSGFFTSPFYPQNYPNSTRCTWLILAPNDYTVTLIFHHFDVEAASPCIFDAVNIYDGSSIRDIQIGKYCGHNKLPPIQKSTGSAMLVELITDVSDHFTGFNCSYHVVKRALNCSDQQTDEENQNIILNGTTGDLVSIFTQPQTVHCTWRIIPHYSATLKRLHLNFTSLDALFNCSRTKVSIYAGMILDSSNLAHEFCSPSQVPPSDTVYRSRVIWVDFKATNISEWKRSFFAAHFNLVEGYWKCSPDNSDENNNINVHESVNPAFHYNDPKKPINTPLNCMWHLNVPQGFRVKLEFQEFLFSGDCEEGRIEILDGHVERGEFCGPSKPWAIYSSSEKMYLKMSKTLSKKNMVKFTARIYAVKNAPDRCSTINTPDINRNIRLSGKQGIFFSPNYPSFYNPNFECVWTITVPHPWRVRLSFDTFSTEGYNCAYDYVEVRDGLGSNSPLSGKFCGSTKPRDVYSSSSQLWIRFTTDKSTEQKGFLASYSVFLPEPNKCSIKNKLEENNDLQEAGHSGFILSPNYPSTYPTNIQCTWKITVPVQNQVELRFENISLPSWCQEAHVKVIDGKSLFGNLLGTYCGDDVPVYIHSTSNIITVMFMSSSEDPGDYRGFNISYNAVRTAPDEVCKTGITTQNSHLSLTRNHGYFASPLVLHQSNFNPFDMSCTWYARAPQGYHIELSFDVIRFPSEHCIDHYVEVRDGDTLVSPLITRRCSELGKRVYSSGRYLVIRLESRRTGRYRGFTARYRMIRAGNCSKDFDDTWNLNLSLHGNNSGVLTSPGYPAPYPPGIQCFWKVSVPRMAGGMSMYIVLEFSEVSLGPNCSTDYVEVKNGLYSFSPVLGRFCGEMDRVKLQPTGPNILVHFKSSNWTNRSNRSNSSVGFYATFYSTGNPNAPVGQGNSSPVGAIVIILGSFGGIVILTLTAIFVYWLVTKDHIHRPIFRRAPPPRDLTPLPGNGVPTLDDIPAVLIAEDRPPTYSEAVEEDALEMTAADVAVVHGGHTGETDTEPPTEEAQGLDNPAYMTSTLELRGDPPSYEDLYGIDPS
ncbi:cubilin [Nematostella vectensis]|uniref:cubilin n=1 Tax=Nematostella vectensis TaxID=45351 RepID=UPI00138FE3EA|nr:cubilin [Nematostella vectensis]